MLYGYNIFKIPKLSLHPFISSCRTCLIHACKHHFGRALLGCMHPWCEQFANATSAIGSRHRIQGGPDHEAAGRNSAAYLEHAILTYLSQKTYGYISKLLSLIFLFIFNYLSYLNFFKNIIYFTMIYFINKKI
jgi:hypothetical protein